MRLPVRRGARPRTIVSTSGSCGILRNVDQNIVTGELDRKRRDRDSGMVIVRASQAVELPGVPWTREIGAIHCPLSEGPASMRAGSCERVDAAVHVADRVTILPDRRLDY